MAKKGISECALCRTEQKLAHSHVWPEFMYEELYDETGRYISLNDDPRAPERPFQKGLREYLLCYACEQHLNRFETYSAKLLRQLRQEPAHNRPGFHIDYEYPRFKLFGLSLIWRVHVASGPGFKSVQLGPVAEDMRRMLLHADPGPPERFPFAIARIDGSDMASTMMTVPQKTLFCGHDAYLGMGYGFRWVFVTAPNAYRLPNELPFVGYSPRLGVAIERTSDSEFVREMREKLPWLLERRNKSGDV
jgi:hypothetical protein